jgi:hypothetical protein
MRLLGLLLDNSQHKNRHYLVPVPLLAFWLVLNMIYAGINAGCFGVPPVVTINHNITHKINKRL